MYFFVFLGIHFLRDHASCNVNWRGGLLLSGVGVEKTNVTVEEPPIPFSPFSSADCTMLNHFSFNDFIAIAFPDIVGDLDAQI